MYIFAFTYMQLDKIDIDYTKSFVNENFRLKISQFYVLYETLKVPKITSFFPTTSV